MCPNKPIPLRYEGRAGTVAKSDTRERSIYLNYITAMKRTDNLSTNGAQTPRTTGCEKGETDTVAFGCGNESV